MDVHGPAESVHCAEVRGAVGSAVLPVRLPQVSTQEVMNTRMDVHAAVMSVFTFLGTVPA